MSTKGHVYLVHLDGEVCPGHPCRHYVGWSGHLEKRLAHHRAGTGSRLLRAANLRGINWRVVRVWKGDGNDERRLKKQNNTPRYCPVCANGRGPSSPEWMGEDLGISEKLTGEK